MHPVNDSFNGNKGEAEGRIFNVTSEAEQDMGAASSHTLPSSTGKPVLSLEVVLHLLDAHEYIHISS
ncbi:hypothetical protein AB1N83_012633 [Pleurotus pulmonarius]